MATNQQRREAAKRKLERQLVHRAERAKRRRIVGAGVVAGVVLVVAGVVTAVVLSNKGDGNNKAATEPSTTSSEPSTQIKIPTERAPMPKRPQPLANPVKCDYPADKTGSAAKPVKPPAGGQVSSTGTIKVTIKSTAGDIPLVLDRALAPCAVDSFISLAKQGYYTDTQCHRLGTSGLQMLQCGDPKGDGTGGPGYTISDENFPELTYGRGMLAMAKTSAPNSGGSQFFMVYGDAQLRPEYSVFGSIADEGLKVLDKIAKDGIDPTAAAQSQDGTGKPKTPVRFTAVTVAD